MDYITVAGRGEYKTVINKSEFIGYVNRAESEDDALSFIKEIKKKHPDARHNVYAYVISENRKRYSDDGEPQGTAGLPLLSAIENNNCIHCVIVVTRYFGGVLLGTGGLHRAYSEAADGALKSAGFVTVCDCATFTIRCDYAKYNKICQIIEKLGGTKPEALFEDKVTIKFAVPQDKAEKAEEDLKEATNNDIIIIRGENAHIGL
jgi:uncharacterized YigZ family protein